MRIYKRVQLKKREIAKIQQDCEGYVWAAIDLSNYAIAFGDDYLADLRDCLLVKRSNPANVFGVGIDLETGRIDYITQINRRNPTVDCNGRLTLETEEKIREVMHYFFEKLPIYCGENSDKQKDYNDAAIAFC